MKTTLKTWPYLSVALAVLLLASSCGRKAQVGEESRLVSKLYHTVWVDPQIAFADSLVTLIRADRIDSLKIEPGEDFPEQPASLEIPVDQPLCNVAVSLLDEHLQMIRPLMVRHLTTGFYRLTLNYDRLNDPRLPPGSYFLRAEYCDSTRVAHFLINY
jgi:hypothetical protein